MPVSHPPAIESPPARPPSLAAISVLVVDDHPAVRVGIERLLDGEPDIVVAATAATLEDALAEARERPVDVAVVDFQLGHQNGLLLTRELEALEHPPRVLIYSAYASAPLAVAAIVAGAHGMLTKGGLGDELCQAVRGLARGRVVLPRITATVVEMLGGRLAPRDRAIYGMLVHGVPAPDVAATLGITDGELEARRRGILATLSAPDEGAESSFGRTGPLDYERARRLRGGTLRRWPAG